MGQLHSQSHFSLGHWDADAQDSVLGTHSQPVSDQRTDALSPGYFHPSILATLHALQLPSSQYQGRSQGLLWGQRVCHIPKDTSVPTLQQGAKPAAGVWACSITLPVAVVWCLSLSNSQELGCQCVNQSFHQAVFPPGARKRPSELQSCEACPWLEGSEVGAKSGSGLQVLQQQVVCEKRRSIAYDPGLSVQCLFGKTHFYLSFLLH